MKQTAVEWLFDKITQNGEIRWRGTRYIELFEQAKAMEKEQMNHIVDINKMVSSQTEISDEEIEKAAAHHEPMVTRRAWVSACKWYREQLKQRQ